jgi:2-keto-4-pentenoate hydratase/2-oxohepta-3-ene-1,7-dioic acid hydratase in catechol pathway
VEVRGGDFWIVDLASAPEEDVGFHLAKMQAEASHTLVTGLAAFDFEPLPLQQATLLAPVTPSKIVCVGRNYREHAQELGNEVPAEPLLFLKPPSSLLAPGGVVQMPTASQRVDYEGELALVIGKRATKVKADADWRSYVRGYTLANDVTARDLQKKDGQWTRAKGFDTFCPVGPLVSDEVDPLAGLTVETRVNGELRQTGSTKDFIFGIPELLAYITAAITLEAGDLVLTGTPAGVGALKPGDQVAIAVTGLGELRHSVSDAS